MSIADLRTIAAAAIAAVTPDYRPGITFREESYRFPLDEQTNVLGGSENTRTFHVLSGFDPVLSDSWRTGKGQPYWRQTLIVHVRYRVSWNDEGWQVIHDFVGTDVPLILQALYEADYGAANIMRVVDVEDADPELELLDEASGLFILRMTPKIFYTRGTAEVA